MNIGITIKKLRRGRDMTQEQLAEYLNVSVSAVSQWESEKTSPDLSVIPAICNLFAVTSDELLGIDLKNKENKIAEICDNADKFIERGYNDKARDIIENGLKIYPDSHRLMLRFMDVNFRFTSDLSCTSEQKIEYFKNTIRYGEKILDDCTNDGIRHSAVQLLCFSYGALGENNKAVSLAKTMSSIAVSSECLLARISKGNERYFNIQHEMDVLFQIFENDLTRLNTMLDSGEFAYTADEMAIIRDKQIFIFEIIFENKDFGFYHTHLNQTHLSQAEYYSGLKNSAKLLYHLSLASYHAVEFIKCNGNFEHTSLIFRGYGKDSGFITGDSDNDAARILEKLKDEIYDFVRNEPEFIQIEENLKKYAGKWQVK